MGISVGFCLVAGIHSKLRKGETGKTTLVYGCADVGVCRKFGKLVLCCVELTKKSNKASACCYWCASMTSRSNDSRVLDSCVANALALYAARSPQITATKGKEVDDRVNPLVSFVLVAFRNVNA